MQPFDNLYDKDRLLFFWIKWFHGRYSDGSENKNAQVECIYIERWIYPQM